MPLKKKKRFPLTIDIKGTSEKSIHFITGTVMEGKQTLLALSDIQTELFTFINGACHRYTFFNTPNLYKSHLSCIYINTNPTVGDYLFILWKIQIKIRLHIVSSCSLFPFALSLMSATKLHVCPLVN